MASKKKQLPWRTLAELPAGSTGRFTAEQIEAAVLAVKAEREALAARARSKLEDQVLEDLSDAEPSRRKARGSRAA